MKLIMKTAIVLILGASAAFAAHTYAGEFYIEPTVFTLDTEVGDFRGVNLTGGYEFTENVAVRGTWMVGAEDETYRDVKISLEEMYGFDLVFTLPVTDSASVYAFGGQTWLEATASAGGYSASAKGDYTTYGLGLRFAARESVGFFGEVKNIDGDTALVVGLRFGL